MARPRCRTCIRDMNRLLMQRAPFPRTWPRGQLQPHTHTSEHAAQQGHQSGALPPAASPLQRRQSQPALQPLQSALMPKGGVLDRPPNSLGPASSISCWCTT